ncbi:MAG: hypothetical protein LBT46_01885 [Planctomycetaceae bacterium]|jgi:hypothetical protein|nr:hypothetical protein [Planctomycetaceae bacterium]
MKRFNIIGSLCLLGMSWCPVFAEEPSVLLPLPAANGAYSGTDNLGRVLPMPGDNSMVPVRKERYAGLFYFLWMAQHGKAGPYDITKIITEHPEAVHNGDHPAWGPINAFHHWGESLYGYYSSEDAWVMRKHIQLLTDAGVDFLVFDATNAFHYPKPAQILCGILDEYQKRGWNVPKIVYYTNSHSGKTIENIYRDIYAKNLYPNLWFHWEGKPLIIGHPEECSDEVKNFFRIKKSQWPNEGKYHQDGFPWIAFERPQHIFKNTAGENEVINVSVAQHAGSIRFSSSAFYGDQSNWTRSWHSGKNDPAKDAVNYGYNIGEQFDFAVSQDPKILFITGWNEWVAMRFKQLVPNEPVGFVDLCGINNSRDIEPMRGGFGDNYYMQMIANIRRYKGAVPKLPVSSAAKKTINVSGDFSQWDSVTALYRDYTNDIVNRNAAGCGDLVYTNTTGRNDFDIMKIALDETYVYFYVQTVNKISPKSNENWMTLYLSVPQLPADDPKTAANWNGYQFAVNRADSGNDSKVTIERSLGGWRWEKIAAADCQVKGNQMQIAVPRKFLDGKQGKPMNMQFKWADNTPADGTIESFYIDGDVAPIGRLNYVFAE